MKRRRRWRYPRCLNIGSFPVKYDFEKGDSDYKELRKSVVLFICSFDPFGKRRYVYTFANRCLEDYDLDFGDGTQKVVVNTKGSIGNISKELKEVIDYLDKGIAEGAYTRQLENAVKAVKASEERRHEYMVRMIRDMEIHEEGREKERKGF